MNKKVALNILKIIASNLLSLLLVLGVVAVPFYYSINALTKPETVSMVIQEVDYKKIIQKNPTIKKTLAKYDITPTKADTIMKSEQTGELLEIYADEVTHIFLDIPKDKKLDVPYIKKLVEDNTDKFLDITEEKTNFKFKRETVVKEVDNFLEKNVVVIEESVATIEQVRDVVKTIYTSRVVKKEVSVLVGVIFISLVFVVIAGIIALMRSNGFLWVGIDFLLITTLLSFIIAFAKSNFISGLALKVSDFNVQIVESAISVSVEKMIIAVFGSIIFAIIFIGFFVALKLLKNKYQKLPAEEATDGEDVI